MCTHPDAAFAALDTRSCFEDRKSRFTCEVFSKEDAKNLKKRTAI